MSRYKTQGSVVLGEQVYYTVREMAKISGLTPEGIRHRIRDRAVPTVLVGPIKVVERSVAETLVFPDERPNAVKQ